jgi:hypothetical protein
MATFLNSDIAQSENNTPLHKVITDAPKMTINNHQGTRPLLFRTTFTDNADPLESEKALYNSIAEMGLPQKHFLHMSHPFTPPESNSSSSVTTPRPFSTPTHPFSSGSPSNDPPDTPPANLNSNWFRRRNSKALHLSLAPESLNITTQINNAAIPPSLSFSYPGQYLQPKKFVDSSSYHSVPSSPASMV